MLKTYGLFAAPLLALALAMPAAADIRPKARPADMVAVADAPAAKRPMRAPIYATAPLSIDVPVPLAPPSLADVAGLVADAPAQLSLATLPIDPPLLAAARAAPRFQVVTSTANAPIAPMRIARLARPMPRPADLVQAVTAPVLPRPLRRSAKVDAVEPAAPRQDNVVLAVAVAAPLLRPEPRPRTFARKAAPAPQDDIVLAAVTPPVNPGKPLVRSKKGSVCGDPAIRGETIPPIPAKMKGCGLADPVRVTEIDGVRLSTPATIDCTTARALKSWVANGLKPAFGKKNPPAVLQVAAHYACRTRNNRPGAPVSEHGRGKAIDISAIVLKSGATVDVLRDYRNSKPLRAAHKAACGTFGTTLGPGSDGYHENHLHFDTANHRNPYCR